MSAICYKPSMRYPVEWVDEVYETCMSRMSLSSYELINENGYGSVIIISRIAVHPTFSFSCRSCTQFVSNGVWGVCMLDRQDRRMSHRSMSHPVFLPTVRAFAFLLPRPVSACIVNVVMSVNVMSGAVDESSSAVPPPPTYLHQPVDQSVSGWVRSMSPLLLQFCAQQFPVSWISRWADETNERTQDEIVDRLWVPVIVVLQ